MLLSSVLEPSLRKWEGKTLAEIGKEMGKDPRDAVMDLVIADRAESSVIISIMREDDVRTALAHPLIAIGTDSGARAEDGPLSVSKSHPRAWGSFTKILGTYVRDEKLITLEDAIRRFTSRPASRMGIPDRGLLRPGLQGRHHHLRPGPGARSFHLHRAESLLRGHPPRAGERPGGGVERRDHRRKAGAGDSRSGV